MHLSSIKIVARHISPLLAFLSTATAQNFTQAQINTVVQRLQQGANYSWELGTRAQALLELSAPSFSVLTPSVHLPPPSSLNSSENASLADVFSIALNAVAALPPPPQNGTGQPFFLGDTSAADPASIGMAVLLANWTNQLGEDYASAATAQVEYLFGPLVPKTSDGAISHRVSQLQLWSDFVSMVPPFLAYYGVTTSNQSMLQEAYQQISLYRNYLSDASANGLWRHIVLGSNGTDPGHWSTGNAWAAAGILRVLGTLNSSPFAEDFTTQIEDLGDWVAEIHGAMYPYLQSNGLFKNYVDNSTDFDDASSSALLAATVYRLVLLTGKGSAFIPQAERTRTAILSANASLSTATLSSSSAAPTNTSTNTSTDTTLSSNNSDVQAYFTADGWLEPVVDPLDITVQGMESPEAEAFVLMLYSAWRDWAASPEGSANLTRSKSKKKSKGGALSLRDDVRRVLLGVAAGLVVLVASCTMGDIFA